MYVHIKHFCLTVVGETLLQNTLVINYIDAINSQWNYSQVLSVLKV